MPNPGGTSRSAAGPERRHQSATAYSPTPRSRRGLFRGPEQHREHTVPSSPASQISIIGDLSGSERRALQAFGSRIYGATDPGNLGSIVGELAHWFSVREAQTNIYAAQTATDIQEIADDTARNAELAEQAADSALLACNETIPIRTVQPLANPQTDITIEDIITP